MKRILAITFLLVSLAASRVIAIENGIYVNSRDASAPLIKMQDGTELHLGAKWLTPVQESQLSSQGNANTNFYLQLTTAYIPDLDSSGCILVIDGTAYRQRGSGSSQNKTSSLDFDIQGDEQAKQVAKYFGTKIIYRRHPQHNLRVEFKPSKSEYLSGEKVMVTLEISNVGTNTISFQRGGRNRASRDNQYMFLAYQGGKQVEDIGQNYHFGGLSTARQLKGGETFTDSIDLNLWFRLEKPGYYQVLGSYYLNFYDPVSRDFRGIWDDYATGEFGFTIKDNPAVQPVIDVSPLKLQP